MSTKGLKATVADTRVGRGSLEAGPATARVPDDANPITIHIRLAGEEGYRRPDILDVAELIAGITGPIALSKNDESTLGKGLRQPFQRCGSRAVAGG
jgi:hypothetical protein